MLDAQTGQGVNNLPIQEMVRLDPQPDIQGSYIVFNTTGTVSYCEQPDIERLTGDAVWHNLECPFGTFGELISEDGIWFWRNNEPRRYICEVCGGGGSLDNGEQCWRCDGNGKLGIVKPSIVAV